MKKITLIFLFAIISKGVFAQVPNYIPTSGLLALYLFSNNTADSSGYGHNGGMCGTGTYGTDRFGHANSCFVDNSESAINFPVNNFPTGNAARTVSVFFKLDSPYAEGASREIFGWGDNYDEGGRFSLECAYYDSSLGWESYNVHVHHHFMPDTFWHNLTVTYPDSGNGTLSISLYIDGEFAIPTSILDTTITSLHTDTGQIHYAGAILISPISEGWYGKLDDIGIWGRALTSCEIETMFFGVDSLVPKITKTGSVYNTDTIYSSYQWFRNDTAIAGATSNSYTSTTTGAYKVAVTTKGGCADTSVAYNKTSITSINLSYDIKVFPNPSETVFNIQSPVAVTVVLTNVLGNTLEKKDNAKQLDLTNYPPGIYLLSIYDENGGKIKTERLSWYGQ